METGGQYDYTQQLADIQQILDNIYTLLAWFDKVGHYAIICGILYFTFRWLYKFFGGFLFGGL